MKPLCSLFLLLSASVLSLPAGARPQASPAAPAGSFLKRPAHSVPQIIKQVQTDGTVRRRFARHYHIAERDVAGTFSHGLRPGKLAQSGAYTVYFVASSGLIYPTRMDLRAGTPVFLDPKGHLMLLWGSGNPLAPFAPATDTQVIIVPPGKSTVTTKEEVIPVPGPEVVVPTPDSSVPDGGSGAAPAPPPPSPTSPAPAVPVTPGSK